MKLFLRTMLALCFLTAFAVVSLNATTITTAGVGTWSSVTPNAPWPGGTPPTSTDDVVVRASDTLTLDMAATCVGLTVNGVYQTSKTVLTDLTINGNLVVNANATFKVQTATTSFTGPHTMTVTGDITNSGIVFDLRSGTAGSTLGVINVTFAGTTNSTVTMVSPYSTVNGDFNAVTINKTGGAKVILASDWYLNAGSSTGPQTMTSILTFVNGIVETGNFTFVAQTSTAANVTGASSTSYVLGAMGRGLSNSAGSSKDFPVGDANGYRPFNLRSTTAGSATGHHAIVRVISGNANTGTSVLNGGIDRVSAVRYYRITYNQLLGGGAASMSFDRFYPTYGTDDGVITGNTNLRVAYSTDARASWTKLGQITSPHTTDLTLPPTQIKPDSVNPAISLAAGTGTMYIALADTADANPLPIQLSSFTASVSDRGGVRLDWTTISEINNYGFHVQRKGDNESTWQRVSVNIIPGHGTTNSPQRYFFVDITPFAGRAQYRLEQIDLNGTVHFTEPIEISGVTGVAENAPVEFGLKQNYPNPFNPSTEVKFSVDKTAKATLEVFNLLGEKVATMFNDVAEAGKYYQVRVDARNFPSGTYIYRLQSGGKSGSKRMLLVK